MTQLQRVGLAWIIVGSAGFATRDWPFWLIWLVLAIFGTLLFTFSNRLVKPKPYFITIIGESSYEFENNLGGWAANGYRLLASGCHSLGEDQYRWWGIMAKSDEEKSNE